MLRILDTKPSQNALDGWHFTSSIKRDAIREARERNGHIHREKAPYPGYRYTVCADPQCKATGATNA